MCIPTTSPKLLRLFLFTEFVWSWRLKEHGVLGRVCQTVRDSAGEMLRHDGIAVLGPNRGTK